MTATKVLFAILLTSHIANGAFIQVERHTLPDRLNSLNGSDENGGCPTECVLEINGIDVCECTGQTTSTLINGVCPTSIDTTQSNWASELFTIDRNGDTTVSIGFELTSRIDFRGVELKLFNCVSEGTAISTVNVYPSSGFPVYGPLVDPSPIGSYVATGDDLSCNSVTILVVPTTRLSFTSDTFFIEFQFPQGDSNTGIYIAEIGFSVTTITAPTEMPTTPAQPSSSQALSPSSSPSPSPSTSTTVLSTSTETQSSSQELSTSTLLSSSSMPPMDTTVTSSPTVTTAATATTSTQTVPNTSPTPLPPSTDPSTTLSTDPPAAAAPLGTIVGSLVGVIVVLLIVILAGVIVVVFFMTKNRQKRGEYDIHHLQGAISETNGQPPDFRRSIAQNQYYEDTIALQNVTDAGYFEVSPEPLYHCVKDSRLQVEAIKSKEEENYYADIKDTNTLPPYAKVAMQDPPPVPKKTPELYHVLHVEQESENGNKTSQVPHIVVDDSDSETVENFGDDENAYQGLNSIDKGSVHSGLAELSKPVLDNMDSNPTYESPDAAMPPPLQDPDEMYANPDALEDEATVEEVVYTEPEPPNKPKRTHKATSVERDTEGLYEDVDRAESEVYTNPDAITSVQVEQDIYTDPDAIDRESAQQAIYDTVYQEHAVARIFDPDSVPPVYENLISDDELFPYAPIYEDTVAPSVKPLDLTPANIRTVKILGTGCFGQVMLVETVALSLKDLKMSEMNDDKSISVQVAVKTLKPTASSSTRESFHKECSFMSKLHHPNVIRFLGVCKEGTPYIMMEYLKHGDLNQYLEEFEAIVVHEESGNPKQISVTTLISMCTQIASAMKYLSSHNYIHRDLAARNCLVGESNTVKLSDFGMSRSLYESHYYVIKGRAILPVRWMSTECFYGKFSVNSDIWAFGVTMWEIFVLTKELPYEDLTDPEVAQDALKMGKRRLLTKPASCPQEVFDIMSKCWQHHPKARAPFNELFDQLSNIKVSKNSDDDDDCV